MLKKNDLVKQFELVVKQEIIEHNKAISLSNLAVNNLGAKLDKLNKINEDQSIVIRNKVDAFKREVESCLSNFQIVKDEFTKLKNDQSAFNAEKQKEINYIDISVSTICKSQKSVMNTFDSQQNSLHEYQKEIKELSKSVVDQIEGLRFSLRKEMDSQKSEILSIPSEAIEVRKEFMNELTIHKVDNTGLLKEIAVLKKTNIIHEKQIENLYTLIERLKDKLT